MALKNAYDSVPAQKSGKLCRRYISGNYNQGCRRALQKASKIKSSKSLKQECALPPTLFKIYLEQALKMQKWKYGRTLNDTRLYTLCFADDQIVLAQNYEGIEYMTSKHIEEYLT